MFSNLASIYETYTWEQSWDMLQKMASNPECTDLIIVLQSNCRFIFIFHFKQKLHKYCFQLDEFSASLISSEQQESVDSHLGGLLHQLLLTCIGDYQKKQTEVISLEIF